MTVLSSNPAAADSTSDAKGPTSRAWHCLSTCEDGATVLDLTVIALLWRRDLRLQKNVEMHC